jgi:hypothetical protein
MRAFAVALVCALAACDLQEITVAESQDIVVAEITLRAGDSIQYAFLHRTLQGGGGESVDDAVVEVTNAGGDVLRFTRTDKQACLSADSEDIAGSCYVSTRNYPVTPGQVYSLRIALAGGGVMTGVTKVPSNFQLTRPTVPVCSLAPNTVLPVAWTVSDDAWVYLSETLLHNLAPVLATQGITLEEDPLLLFGLSISNQDTTILFPSQFGLFQRFDESLTAALIAIQSGLPPGVVADVTIAAGDRNFVNWERGGNFNPSGAIRVASIRGDGTGTFGSIVPLKFVVRTDTNTFPAC